MVIHSTMQYIRAAETQINLKVAHRMQSEINNAVIDSFFICFCLINSLTINFLNQPVFFYLCVADKKNNWNKKTVAFRTM